MTNRTKQRQIKRMVDTDDKREIRRIRKGRAASTQAGQGHGDRTYQPVLTSAQKIEHAKERAAAKKSVGLLQRIFGG